MERQIWKEKVVEAYYEHPKGYRPNKKKLNNCVFIADMKMGDRFIASDGLNYKVVRPITRTCCTRGFAEYDMWARRIGTEDVFLFLCPVGGNPLRYTYITL